MHGPDHSIPTMTAFYHAGEYVGSLEPDCMVGSLYVDLWQTEVVKPFPLVMIHGGAQTGICFTVKPDGTQAWAQYIGIAKCNIKF